MNKFGFYCAVIGVSVFCATSFADENTAKPEQAGYEHAHQDRNHGDGAEFHHPPIEKIVNLSNDQKKKLQDIRVKQRSTQKPVESQIHEAHTALNKAGETNANDVELQRLANQLGSLVAQQEVDRIKFHQQVVEILTPEQRQQLLSWRADHEADMNKHHHGDDKK